MVLQQAGNSLKQIALQDSYGTAQQLKQLAQFRLVTDWIKKTRNADKEAKPNTPDEIDNGDSGTVTKKAMMNELARVITPKLPQMIRERIESVVKERLEKGIDELSLPLSPLRVSVTFMLLVDGVVVKNGLLELVFEIQSNTLLRGAKVQLNESPKLLKADSMDVRLMLYYLLPMMWGTKYVRMGEDNFTVKNDVNFALGTQ